MAKNISLSLLLLLLLAAAFWPRFCSTASDNAACDRASWECNATNTWTHPNSLDMEEKGYAITVKPFVSSWPSYFHRLTGEPKRAAGGVQRIQHPVIL